MAVVVWVGEEVTSRKRSAEERNDDKRLNVSDGAAEPIETQGERSCPGDAPTPLMCVFLESWDLRQTSEEMRPKLWRRG